MIMSEQIEIPAIHDDDLKTILEKHKMLTKIEKGEIKCMSCETPITWDNIYGLTFKDNELELVCDSIDCIEKLNYLK